MKTKYILIIIALVIGIFLLKVLRDSTYVDSFQPVTSQSDNSERDAFVNSIMNLNQARDLSNKITSLTLTKTSEEESQIYDLTNKGLELSKGVSDEFLQSIHPQLKEIYREKLIKGTQLWLEGAQSTDIQLGTEKQMQGNMLVNGWISWFDSNGKSLENKIFK